MNQSLSARAAPPIWMLALAVSGANVGMSLLSPAVPDLRADLLATADEAQLVLSGFLVMLGLGQLGAGSVSDSVGRRPVMMFGALLFAVSGIGALLAPNVWLLILMRVLQGIGAAACMAMGRVIVNDGFSREEAGRQLSTITMFQAVVPILGFAFGGMLADLVGWRGAVAVMVATAAVVLFATIFLLRETRLEKSPPMPVGRMIGVYVRLLGTPKFISNAGAAALDGWDEPEGGVLDRHAQLARRSGDHATAAASLARWIERVVVTSCHLAQGGAGGRAVPHAHDVAPPRWRSAGAPGRRGKGISTGGPGAPEQVHEARAHGAGVAPGAVGGEQDLELIFKQAGRPKQTTRAESRHPGELPVRATHPPEGPKVLVESNHADETGAQARSRRGG